MTMVHFLLYLNFRLRSKRWLPFLVSISLAVGVSAADASPAAETANSALEHLRAANVARAELAREESVWRSERQRLQAAIAATRAEQARLSRDAAEIESQTEHTRAKLAALNAASELDALRLRLGEASAQLNTALNALARTVPPGTIGIPAAGLTGEAAFDAVIRALDASERAASAVAVEVVSGTRDGQSDGKSEAVKLLRVAGAVAWWVALDGSAAGNARMIDGKLQLENTADERTRLDIALALAQAEGRAQPTIVLLPAPNTTGGAP
jgi:DNA repair exonuclease SbcCD ATPase subunit